MASFCPQQLPLHSSWATSIVDGAGKPKFRLLGLSLPPRQKPRCWSRDAVGMPSLPLPVCLSVAMPASGQGDPGGFAPWRGHCAKTQSAFCCLCALLSRRSDQRVGGVSWDSSAVSRRIWMGGEDQVLWPVPSVGSGPGEKDGKEQECCWCACAGVS